MDEPTSFGYWVRRRRKALDLTQEALAARVGLSVAMIRRVEADERRPSREVAGLLAQVLELLPAERDAFIKAARAELAVDHLPRAAVHPGASAVRALGDRRANHRTNLPVQRDPLIGREQELGSVVALVRRSEVGLVTLTGPGGTGKTCLALQAAGALLDTFADGVWLVDLAPLSDPALVPSTIAAVLGIREIGTPAPVDSLKLYLRDKTVLLLLDNFEQVVDAAPLVADLLAAATQLKVLITSRVVLHVRGEQEVPVPPLALPDLHQLPAVERLAQYAAVALFSTRARAVKPDFQVTQVNAPAVAAICARLDGLPLAIELAAARIKLFPPQALLPQLERRLQLLTGGARDLPARQQTMRNTIDWSYDLLDAGKQTLFARLGVFVGGCTLAAAAAVCTADGELRIDVIDGIAALLDQSLVRQDEGLDGQPRVVMLETLREYALERLEQRGEADALRRQHAHFFLRWAEESAGLGSLQRLWLERFEADHDNVRAALTWSVTGGFAEVTLRLATALGGFWLTRGYLSEGRRWLEAALDHSSAVPAAARAKAFVTAGELVERQGDDMQATALYEASLALWRELGRQEEIAWTTLLLGRVAAFQNDAVQATARLEESLALFRQLDDRPGIAWALKELGAEGNEQWDYARSKALLEESLALFRQLDDQNGIADTLHVLGINARLQGDAARALVLEQESLALCRKQGPKHLMPAVLIGLGYVAQRQGDGARARGYFVEALTVCRELGDQRMPAVCLAGLAGVAGMQGQPVRAARLFGAAEALAEVLHVRPTAHHRIEGERIVALTRAQLDEAPFAAAWEGGRALSLEQAIAEALEEHDGRASQPHADSGHENGSAPDPTLPGT